MIKYIGIWPIAYLALIVCINIGFSHLELMQTPLGKLAPMTFFVGFVFILRDYAQRQIGHWILIYMVAALALSYWMADPFVALASAAAFAASEFIDWAVYTATKKPLRERVIYSSLAGVPVDSAIFLALIGHLTFSGFALMCAVKFLALVWILFINKPRNGGGSQYRSDPYDIYANM